MNKFHTVANGFSTLVPVVLTEVRHLNEKGEFVESAAAQMAIQIHENLETATLFVDKYNEMVEGRHASRAVVGNSYNMELRDLMNTKKWGFMGMSYHSFR